MDILTGGGNLMKIGERIKFIRESKNISQCELADLIHISPSFLCRIETGSSTASIDCICSIAKALNCTPQDILCDIFEYPEEVTISDKVKIMVEQFPIEKQLLLLETLEFLSDRLQK